MLAVLLYIIILIGSFPIGYSLTRIVLPEKQGSNLQEKISYGYALGLIVFLPGIISIFIISEEVFYLFSGAMYAFLFTILLFERKKSSIIETEELVKDKKSIKIPKRALTKEEKQKKNKKKIPKTKTKKEDEVEKDYSSMIKITSKEDREKQKAHKDKDHKDKKKVLEDLRNFIKEPDKKSNKKKKEDFSLEDLKEFEIEDF